jgi:hypothetical protein
MIRLILTISVIAICITGCKDSKIMKSNTAKQVSAESSVVPIFESPEKSPQILAESANALIGMGEEKAVKLLKKYAKTQKDYDHPYALKVAWMCKLIFTPKTDKPLRPPSYGALSLPRISMPLKEWPLYPLVLTDGVIFILGDGYSLFGQAEPPLSYINYCLKNGSFKQTKYKVPTTEETEVALEKLFASERWKNIKWSHSEKNLEYTYSESWQKDKMKRQIK